MFWYMVFLPYAIICPPQFFAFLFTNTTSIHPTHWHASPNFTHKKESPQRFHQCLPPPWSQLWFLYHGKLGKMLGNPGWEIVQQKVQHICVNLWKFMKGGRISGSSRYKQNCFCWQGRRPIICVLCYLLSRSVVIQTCALRFVASIGRERKNQVRRGVDELLRSRCLAFTSFRAGQMFSGGWDLPLWEGQTQKPDTPHKAAVLCRDPVSDYHIFGQNWRLFFFWYRIITNLDKIFFLKEEE